MRVSACAIRRGTAFPTLALALTMTLVACGPSSLFRSMRDAPATAYARYAESLRDAGLEQTALGREWLAASDSALRAPLAATLPAREIGEYSRSEARAVAYRISLREGQRFRAMLRADGLSALVFLDLFEVTGDTTQPFAHRASADSLAVPDSAIALLTVAHEVDRDGVFVLRLQPELLRNGRYELTMEVEPMLAFPVEGRGNGAIQSLFGVARDGGRRAHHGIDIFAPRGTPVVAVADGTVRSVSPNTLGGNVVWLSDEARGQSLYYAHLDSHAVTEGQRVRVGDTLGFVGNSGNARTTAPHLHFGIYRRGRGPIDPLRYVQLVRTRPPAVAADTARLGRAALTTAGESAMRIAPGPRDSVVRRIPRATVLYIMGASGNSYRVQLDDGTPGYVSARAVRFVEE